MRRDRLQVVLLRTRNAQNLGAVCRAMKNFGLSRLTLVDPRVQDLALAEEVAVHSADVLRARRTVSTLGEATADAVWVVGTTSRNLAGQRRLTPRALAQEAAERSQAGEVVLLFGDEESGLSNAELLACHAVSTIPALPAQPSLNLGQAVLTYAYELSQVAGASEPTAPSPPRAEERLLGDVEAALRQLLDAAAFADPDRPGHGVAELAQTLRRAALTPAEARLWQAALRRAVAQLRVRR